MATGDPRVMGANSPPALKPEHRELGRDSETHLDPNNSAVLPRETDLLSFCILKAPSEFILPALGHWLKTSLVIEEKPEPPARSVLRGKDQQNLGGNRLNFALPGEK